jgi:hypothetical protein
MKVVLAVTASAENALRRLRSAGCRPAILMAAVVLASCATMEPDAELAAVEAPALRVGDRWVYHGVDGYRAPVVWDETHEITEIGPDGIRVRVTLEGPTVDIQRTETWPAPGIVSSGAVYDAETNRFDPPLIRYKFPLARGESWSQATRDLHKPPGPFGPIRRRVAVDGYESVTTPAGTFDAVRMRIIMQLDDETFWRYATECNYLVWYAPAASAVVREEKRSSYRDKSNYKGANPGQNATLVLTSFTRGR